MRGLEFLAIDLTHRCNLRCPSCSKLTATGTWQATLTEVEAFCTLCADTPARNIRVGGGEVLTHPYIDPYLKLLLALGKPIELATNGILLPKHEWLLDQVHAIHITVYHGVNDHIVKRYRNHSHVNLIDWGVNWGERWFDPRCNPAYTIEQAQAKYDTCPCCMVVVSGLRVYGCGVAEPLERVRGVQPVSIPLQVGWMSKYESFSPLAACQRCYQIANQPAPFVGPRSNHDS